jgi:probable F420-dependent oxidoreductase
MSVNVGSIGVWNRGPAWSEHTAGERTAGAHPYLVTPEYTGIARETLGPDALLAVEQKVVLESEPVRARELARARVGPYMAMPNYTNNLLRLGFGDADFADGGSDRVLEALVASGEQAIRERVHAHLQAGADHVCLQVLDGDLPREQWRRLAPVLIDA